MSKTEKISTFDQLEKRKRELELEVKVSERELAHSLGTSKVNLNDFLLKKVALPIGGAIAGVYLISKIKGKKKPYTHEYHEKTIIKEVPAYAADDDKDPAKYRYPVPPPEERDDEPHQQQFAAAPQGKQKKARITKKEKNKIINRTTIASVARVAIPAIRMIYKTVQDYQAKQGEN